MIEYIIIDYKLKFEDDILWNRNPNFIFRSVLGYQLKNLTCVLKKNKCETCMLNSSCVYANFFETPITKDKTYLLGRNKAPHPFSINVDLQGKNEAIIQIVFIGISRNYIPYITLAIEKAGEKGVSKSRTKYEIINITHNGIPFVFDIKRLKDQVNTWPSNLNNLNFDTIEFVTPCRIKKQGHYINQITIDNLINAIERRIQILDSLYGDGKFEIDNSQREIEGSVINQKWIDLNYYSSRQKEAMKIGGVVGSLKINNPITEYQKQIIYASEIFNVGKNISMGLGNVKLKKGEL